MWYFYLSILYIFFVFVKDSYGTDNIMQLRYGDKSDPTNLQCKDNDESLVDWWYIYKPPMQTGDYYESGTNFTYAATGSEGRWFVSQKHINSDSMLQNTIRPLYRDSYKTNLAVMLYGEVSGLSSANGVLFANDKGGVWISHTVPNFPDLNFDYPKFPENEFRRGHMLMCVTLDLNAVNSLAVVIQHTQSDIYEYNLPEHLESSLPKWKLIESNASDISIENNDTQTYKKKVMAFSSRFRTMQGVILARSPGDSGFLYKAFARLQEIIIDVYNNAPNKLEPICTDEYGLRHIDALSLKFPDQKVYYIRNTTDLSTFGVSTAAAWQKRTKSLSQYWTCFGNIGFEDTNGALIICARHYKIWLTFDKLKAHEPDC